MANFVENDIAMKIWTRCLNPVVILGLLGASGLLQGCASTEVADSGDVNQSQIYQQYRVTIDRGNNMQTAEAQFRFGGALGTTLLLTHPSEVTVNGKAMKGDTRFMQGLVYSHPNLGQGDSEFEFVFSDVEETTYRNKLVLEPIGPGENIPDEISRHQPTQIPWQGAPVGDNETVTLYLTDRNNGKVPLSTSIKGETEIEMLPDQIANLSGGVGNLQFTRRVSTQPQQTGAIGGHLQGTFYSEISTVQIAPAVESTPADTAQSAEVL